MIREPNTLNTKDLLLRLQWVKTFFLKNWQIK